MYQFILPYQSMLPFEEKRVFNTPLSPSYAAFGDLTNLNDIILPPDEALPPRPVQNTHLLTLVLSGALTVSGHGQKKRVLRPLQTQLISAGNNALMSFQNNDPARAVHFLQLELGGASATGETVETVKKMPREMVRDRFGLIASPTGEKKSLVLEGNNKIYLAFLKEGATDIYRTNPERAYWIYCISGIVCVNDRLLTKGDSLAVWEEAEELAISGVEGVSKIVLVNLTPPEI